MFEIGLDSYIMSRCDFGDKQVHIFYVSRVELPVELTLLMINKMCMFVTEIAVQNHVTVQPYTAC